VNVLKVSDSFFRAPSVCKCRYK